MMFGYLPFESSSTFYTEALILAHKVRRVLPVGRAPHRVFYLFIFLSTHYESRALKFFS